MNLLKKFPYWCLLSLKTGKKEVKLVEGGKKPSGLSSTNITSLLPAYNFNLYMVIISNIPIFLSFCYSEGVVEIWLTSEDLGAYGRDIGVTLPELLWQLVEVVPDGCMLRLGMTNPPYIMEHVREMAAILAHPRVYSFLHVPVQCGSDAVLEDMKREYMIADFRHLVDYLKDK